MAHTPLPKLEVKRPLVALLGYPAVLLFPLAISWGLFELIGFVRGERLPVLELLLVVFGIRTANVFVISTLLHRSMSHQAFRYHPVLERALRVWSWLFIGIGMRTFAMLHRFHHAHTDTADDPHSPSKAGESWWTIAAQSHRAYMDILQHPENYARYSKNLPEDRFEAFCTREEKRGFGMRGFRGPLFALIGVGSFGALLGPGTGVAVFFASLPTALGGAFATSVLTINGLCHLVGYRAYASDETSTNLFPLDLLAMGEALHQNHHASPGSANFAHHAWEWDPSYTVLWLLSKLRLVRDLQRPELVPATGHAPDPS